MFRSALRKCLTPKPTAPIRRTPPRRLAVENLEDRLVPATYVVDPGQSIQAVLDTAAAQPGADIVVVNAGTYAENLVINDPANVTLKANGTVTLTSAPAPASVTLGTDDIGAAVIDIYSNKVVVDGFTIDGTAGPANLSAGIRVIDGGSATIKNNTVTNINTSADVSFGIGIQVGTNRGGSLGAGTAKVNNNVITGYSGAGVLVDGGSSSATIRDNTITGRGLANNGVSQYGVQVSRGAAARVEKNTISGNDIDGAVEGGSNPATASAGVYVFQNGAKGIVVAKNDISGNDYGVLVESADATGNGAVEIVNNDLFANNGYAAIGVIESSGVEIENNDVFDNTSWNGIALDFSTDVEVKGNSIHDNANADGIYAYFSDNNKIKANDSYNNGFNGILLEESSNNFLWNNHTSGNELNGIKVLGGSGNDLWLGVSECNNLDGILLEDTACNTVVGNALLSNGGYGLNLVNADNTFIAFNLVCGNNEGSIYTDANSTGTVTIANRTDTPPEREGTTGSAGTGTAYASAYSDAEDDVLGLED